MQCNISIHTLLRVRTELIIHLSEKQNIQGEKNMKSLSEAARLTIYNIGGGRGGGGVKMAMRQQIMKKCPCVHNNNTTLI